MRGALSRISGSWPLTLTRWTLIMIVIFLISILLSEVSAASMRSGGSVTILRPERIGGTSGQDDQRDIDIYPAVAYDDTTNRYLVVWLTGRNAGSSSDGLDVYGRFLDQKGHPEGDEFRISDQNDVARNGLPKVVAGNGEFVVLWTKRGSRCSIVGQRVTNTSPRSDWTIASNISHNHSPAVVYNPVRQRYVMAYVDGDDYLPPTLFASETADCGNSRQSSSEVKAIEFYLSGDNPVIINQVQVSDVGVGAFRPDIAYHANLNSFFVSWEDRRNAGNRAFQFGVYGQRLQGNLVKAGNNLQLATNRGYENGDGSATWTPRPRVEAGADRFLVLWFEQEQMGSAREWNIRGALVANNNIPQFHQISRMTFANNHPGNAPTGFPAIVYNRPASEYMVSMTTHLESLWGYFSSARIQRVLDNGQLLKLDGSIRDRAGVGYSVDYTNDDQLSIAAAANPATTDGASDVLLVYAKHAPNQHTRDFDIWAVRIRVPVASLEPVVWLPLAWR